MMMPSVPVLDENTKLKVYEGICMKKDAATSYNASKAIFQLVSRLSHNDVLIVLISGTVVLKKYLRIHENANLKIPECYINWTLNTLYTVVMPFRKFLKTRSSLKPKVPLCVWRTIVHQITYCKACIFRLHVFFANFAFFPSNAKYAWREIVHAPFFFIYHLFVWLIKDTYSRKIPVAKIFTRQNANNSYARKIHALQ